MSVEIPLSCLNPTFLQKILSDCIFSYRSKYTNKTKNCIVCYLDDKIMRIPYIYATMIIGQRFPNISKAAKMGAFTIKPSFSLRPYQVEVVDKAKQMIYDHGTVFLNVFCAFGKTVTAMYLAHWAMMNTGYRICITYPLTMLLKSWVGTFEKFTDASVAIVGQSSEEQIATAQVVLCSVGMLDKLKGQSFGIIIIDEIDLYCTEIRIQRLLNFATANILIGCSATYTREDGFHRYIDYLLGTEKITRISTREFYVFKYSTKYRPEVKYIKRAGNTIKDFDRMLASMDENEERTADMVRLCRLNSSHKPLLMTKHVLKARYYAQCLQKHFSSVACIVEDVREYNDAPVVVGTYSKIGVGYDEQESCIDWEGKRLDVGIIESSTKKIEQIAGRVFRAENVFIIHIVDDDDTFRRHFDICAEWYTSRGGIIIEVDKPFIIEKVISESQK